MIGYAGLTFGNVLVGIGSVVLLGGGFAASVMLNNFWIIAILGVLWLLAIFALAYVTSVASQIYKGALYLYAAQGVLPEPYNQQMLDAAWKFKKN